MKPSDMSQNSYIEDADEEVEEVYSVRRGVDELIGNHEHLRMFVTSDRQITVYYQTYGGGDEGGYFRRVCGTIKEIYAVNRTWGTPFTVTRISGQLTYTPPTDTTVPTVRFVQDIEQNWRLPQN